SLERFSVDNSSTDSSNWSTSAGIVKATPGRINSITPKENDLTVAEFITTLPYSIIGEEIEFKIKIKNAGTNNSPNFTINLYYDTNLDSIPQQSELLISLPQNGIISGDSVDAVYLTNQFEASENHYIALIDVSIDDDSSNNIGFTKVTGVNINEVRNDIVINEFMYAPQSPETEWIEIYNRSSKTIDLKNYRVSDNNDTVRVVTQS